MSSGPIPARPAVFVDRDGTLIYDKGYLANPDDVTLMTDAIHAIARLRSAGFAVVIVTNQSGIAQGRITGSAYAAVEARVVALLTAGGAAVERTYMCPHHPDVSGPCECRKPAPGLFRRAAQDLSLDLSRSVLVGDRWRDIAPADVLHARGILVPNAATPADDLREAREHAVIAPTLTAAVDMILGHHP
jgi:D-glycero-D-manno-heptose 1,7-bisphosphate phosphatase